MKTSIRSYQHENKESQKPIKNKAGLYRDIIDRMGVKDLWQLLSPVGRRVSIETLEGKVSGPQLLLALEATLICGIVVSLNFNVLLYID